MTTAGAYSWSDRLLHSLAFAGIGVQKALSDMEDRLYAKRFAHVSVDAPVFVTSLPRAGTTLFLDVLYTLPNVATHTYRHMPFILCPLLWQRISAGLRKDAEVKERAHGDGVMVSVDSPEAFEEVIWKAFWPDHYRDDRITPWSETDRDPEFETGFRNHIRKIIALASSSTGGGPVRYISKNNANIARLPLLRTLFPDCRVIVPVREPWDHVGSLMGQHERFLAIHAEDPFGRKYMEWLGHYEFGAALRPIDFGSWIDRNPGLDPKGRVFWLTYWAEAYESVLSSLGPNVHIIDYERACENPKPVLAALGAALDLPDPDALVGEAGRFRPSRRYEHDSADRESDLGRRVSTLYQELRDRAI